MATVWLSPRSLAVFLLIMSAGFLYPLSSAHADEQRVSRLGIAIFAGVTSLSPNTINSSIADLNRLSKEEGDLAPIGDINAAPFFQAEARFFVSDKIVAVAGIGKISSTSKLDLQPRKDMEILIQGRIKGVPLHAGVDYYFTPYTSGDVTLRPFVGGGFISLVEAKGKVGARIVFPDTPPIDEFLRVRGEGQGFYIESGVHLMLASKYSFIANVNYHYLKASRLRAEDALGGIIRDPDIDDPVLDSDGEPLELDFSGLMLRLGVNINIWDRF